MRWQERYHSAIQAVAGFAESNPGSGFTSLAFEAGALVVYWKGQLPPEVSAAVGLARSTLGVSVRSAPFSLAELDRAARTLEIATRASDVQSITPRHDGSALIVERFPTGVADRLAARRGTAVPSAASALASVRHSVGVPVEVRTATTLVQPQSTRADDFSPWNAGAVIRNFDAPKAQQNGWPVECSAGFGVLRSGRYHVLTAAHCGTAPDRFFHGEVGINLEEIGVAGAADWDKDIMLINGSGSPFMFDGDGLMNGGPGTSRTKTVRSWGYYVVNELVCQSGMWSGVVCGLRSQDGPWAYWLCDSDLDCFYVHRMVKTIKDGGGIASRGGDSGGPVFTLDGDGVRAKGVLSGGSTGGGPIMMFQDIADVHRLFGFIRIG